MAACQQEERAAGRPYPRTCPTCKLGPCQRPVPPSAPADEIAALQARVTELKGALTDVGAHLVAAISLLERSGKAAKKAAASDKMFDQMLNDYRASLERARAVLKGNPNAHD